MMDNQMIVRRAKSLYRVGFGICLVATVLGTLAAMNGSWVSWAVNCGIFLAAGYCTIWNIRIAGQHSQEN